MKQKKIAVLATTIHPVKQRHLIDWYNDISNNSFQIKLFTQQRISKSHKLNRLKLKFKIHFLEYAFKNLKFGILINPEKNVLRPISDFKPDLIHLLTSHTFEEVDEYFVKNKSKLIISFRGYDINIKPTLSESNLIHLKRMFEAADCLHFISKDLMNKAIEYGASESKCVVIYRSIKINSIPSLNELIELRKKNEIPVIITTARLVWEKGFINALTALKILKVNGYKFRYFIIGEGDEREKLESFVNDNNLDHEVKFFGELSHERVFDFLKTSNIYLQTSVSEALSNSIIEASFYGLPIVASNVGGIPEVVENGVTGFLSKPEDYLDICENLSKLIDDIDLRESMGFEGQKKVISKFSRSNEILLWNQLYNDVIAGDFGN